MGIRRALGVLVAGAAAGAAFALLYAPASGAATRQLLGRRVRDGRRRANGMLKRGLKTIDEGRERLTSAVDEGRTRLRQAKEHAEEAIEEGRDAAGRIADHGRKAAGEVQQLLRRVRS